MKEIRIDLGSLYDAVARSMAFKGREGEHKAAVQRMKDVLEMAREVFSDPR